MAACLVAFNWTTYDIPSSSYASTSITDLEAAEVLIPRTIHPEQEVLVVPIDQIHKLEVVDVPVEMPEFVAEVIKPTTVEESTSIGSTLATAPTPHLDEALAPPPIIESETTEIHRRAEQMPRFPGCEDLPGDQSAKDKCAEEALLSYIYKALDYPRIARQNQIEGMAVIQFVVDVDGRISDATILRDIGGGCGSAALAVVLAMNDLAHPWTPGMQRGRAVRVLYTLPIRFKLQ